MAEHTSKDFPKKLAAIIAGSVDKLNESVAALPSKNFKADLVTESAAAMLKGASYPNFQLQVRTDAFENLLSGVRLLGNKGIAILELFG